MKTKATQSRFDNNYNVLYFGGEIDFRLIPKNCSSTIKVLWSDLYGLPYKETDIENPHGYYPNRQTEYLRRKRFVNANGGMWRDGALKFAIKRDPIERWISTINFSIQMKDYGKYAEFLNLDWIDKDINDIAKDHRETGIDSIQDYGLTELYSQTYCGGDIRQYQHVFDIKDFDKCKALMENILDYEFPDIHATVSKDKAKWKFSDLTTTAIDDIKTLYRKDYNNLWF